jgi:hypothetical protein
MNENEIIEINAEFMEKTRKAINAFFWDNIECANTSFEYFKSQVEDAVKTENDIDDFSNTIAELFVAACDLEGVSCKYGYEIEDFLKKSLKRFGISLKDTNHKDFEAIDDDEYGNNLNSVTVILAEFDISLWSCEDTGGMYELAVSRRIDDELIAEAFDSMSIDINLLTWYAPSKKSESLQSQEKMEPAKKTEWELWMEKSRAARNR